MYFIFKTVLLIILATSMIVMLGDAVVTEIKASGEPSHVYIYRYDTEAEAYSFIGVGKGGQVMVNRNSEKLVKLLDIDNYLERGALDYNYVSFGTDVDIYEEKLQENRLKSVPTYYGAI